MPRRKLLVTGARGVIGSAVIARLQGVEVTPADLPECDVRDQDALASLVCGQGCVLHLAWNCETENYRSDSIDADNIQMTANVFAQAHRHGVGRVIIASSIHADQAIPPSDGLLSTDSMPTPDSPYGASKCFMEALGRHYATRGMEVIAVRFGGVNAADVPPPGGGLEPRRWLSHSDCATLIQRCIDAQVVPGKYCCLYAVSNNPWRYHDISNPFGWAPLDG